LLWPLLWLDGAEDGSEALRGRPDGRRRRRAASLSGRAVTSGSPTSPGRLTPPGWLRSLSTKIHSSHRWCHVLRSNQPLERSMKGFETSKTTRRIVASLRRLYAEPSPYADTELEAPGKNALH